MWASRGLDGIGEAFHVQSQQATKIELPIRGGRRKAQNQRKC
uniref:Uncharacterized protein n=1 Tax=Rhizophora mucronata TaxID=61149 RepID=A0A2P2P9U2_RHIMU